MKTKLTKLPHFATLLMIILVATSSLLTSCVKIEEAGHPGRSFVSLVWNETPPTFVDAGTYAFPRHFQYNQYYLIEPGSYHLYYEGTDYYYGEYYDYAWDMDYEIWINPSRHSGYDGADNYFTLELNPYGPDWYVEAKGGKTEISGYQVLECTEKRVVLERKSNDVGIKITYSRVIPKKFKK